MNFEKICTHLNAINKRKIVNDPVHGFIKIPTDFIFDLLSHPFLQRLRRIRQLGLTSFVYPGATHTRFQHALGSVHLMSLAIENLRQKGTDITDVEAEAAQAAILLHDIGHGPFSHALEQSLIKGLSHEDLSLLLMRQLNREFSGRLSMALDIFNNNHPKPFLHQLVSGQLDMDRMDYLMRDSFYTGVAEGTIGTDRIIKMLNVANGQLVAEAKGIYSIEKFLIARRLMYWQVYFHKTVIAAENLLVHLLRRARYLALQGDTLFATPPLAYFLNSQLSGESFSEKEEEILVAFAGLDDDDIMVSAKIWASHRDPLLQILASSLVSRNLPRVRLSDIQFDEEAVTLLRKQAAAYFQVPEEDAAYLVYTGDIENMAYQPGADRIGIYYNTGEVIELSKASDIFRMQNMNETRKKYFLSFPKVSGFNY